VLWRCWLGGGKGIRPVKNWVVGCWCGCLGWGADLHIAEQMPLPLTISCSIKSRLVLTFLVLPFWYLLTRVVPDIFQKSSKMVVCVRACVVSTSFNAFVGYFSWGNPTIPVLVGHRNPEKQARWANCPTHDPGLRQLHLWLCVCKRKMAELSTLLSAGPRHVLTMRSKCQRLRLRSDGCQVTAWQAQWSACWYSCLSFLVIVRKMAATWWVVQSKHILIAVESVCKVQHCYHSCAHCWHTVDCVHVSGRMACRCFWDSDTDNCAQDIFMNVWTAKLMIVISTA